MHLLTLKRWLVFSFGQKLLLLPRSKDSSGNGFAGADFAGDHAESAFADAPVDAGDGFAVTG